MIQAFYMKEDLKLINIEMDDLFNSKFPNVKKWIHVTSPTDKEIEIISQLTDFAEQDLKAPLDEEERARIEKENDKLTILFDIPMMEEEEGNYYSYTTIPLGIFIKDEYFVTITLKESILIKDFIMGRIKGFDINKRTRFVFQLLYFTSKKYLNYLKQIDRASQRIQKELHKSTKNKELIQLLDLENSLVYFSTSLMSNDLVIGKLANTSTYLRKYEEDQDLLEDVAIENKQAIEMCNIYKDILGGTMDAFASVISNNQNIVIKLLTIVTLIISIPSMIAAFYGMNVDDIPLRSVKGAFWIIVAFSAILSAIVGILLFKKK